MVKTTEMAKIELDKKTDLVPSVVPQEPRVMKPKPELPAALKVEPSKKLEPALVPTKKHDTSPVPPKVQKADVFKIQELTPASRELVEVHLAKMSDPTPLSPEIRKPEPSRKPELSSISKAEPVIKEVPKVVLPEALKVEPELPQAKSEPIQEKEQTPFAQKKCPPKRGIITSLIYVHSI